MAQLHGVDLPGIPAPTENCFKYSAFHQRLIMVLVFLRPSPDKEKQMRLLKLHPAWLEMAFILAAILVFPGCAQKPAPPIFSLYGYQRVAVIPFNNQSTDSELARSIQEQMTAQIVGINAVPMIEADQVAAYLRALNAQASSVAVDSELRNKLGRKFLCDLLLIGSADGYDEVLEDQMPQRVVVNDKTGEAKWGFYTNRKVTVNASAKLLDLTTGSLLWTRQGQGYSYQNTWNPLPIPGSVKMPDELSEFMNLKNLIKHRVKDEAEGDRRLDGDRRPVKLHYPRSTTFANLRQNAINQAVRYMVGDFRPRGGWTPQLKGDSSQP
jgi:hypothetical protein